MGSNIFNFQKKVKEEEENNRNKPADCTGVLVIAHRVPPKQQIT